MPLEHLVLVKPKEEVSEAQIAGLIAAFKALSAIPGVEALTAGMSSLPLCCFCCCCCLLTFSSSKARTSRIGRRAFSSAPV